MCESSYQTVVTATDPSIAQLEADSWLCLFLHLLGGSRGLPFDCSRPDLVKVTCCLSLVCVLESLFPFVTRICLNVCFECPEDLQDWVGKKAITH